MAGALGRIVEHDPRSLEYAAPQAPALRSVAHKRHGPPFDQGQLGSCTGNAIAGLLMTDPYWHRNRHLTEADAVKFYKYATAHDSEPGTYPPDDTGSSGLAAAKAAKHYGYINSYAHAFGLQHTLAALVLDPVMIGVNWYEGFDNPDPHGHVTISGQVRGGHEFELLAIDVELQRVQAINSWGIGYGEGGYFNFSWDDLDRLLSEQGDCTVVKV
jgi:hypothetical protein